MTLRVVIQPAGDYVGNYPVFYTMDQPKGVTVGPAGELILVAEENICDNASRFRIYAPGTWKEINVEEAE